MLSIIIPCYNAGRYIVNCLKSIENSGKEYSSLYEIVIINDGSTDNTNDELASFCKQTMGGGKNN